MEKTKEQKVKEIELNNNRAKNIIHQFEEEVDRVNRKGIVPSLAIVSMQFYKDLIASIWLNPDNIMQNRTHNQTSPLDELNMLCGIEIFVTRIDTYLIRVFGKETKHGE